MIRLLAVWLLRTLFLLLSVLVLLCLVVFWLLRTESGTNKLIRFGLSSQNIPVQIERIEGTFGTGLSLSGIAYSSGELSLEVESLLLDLRLIELFGKKVIIDRLHIDNVLVVQTVSSDADLVKKETFKLPRNIELPVDIGIDDFLLTRLKFGATRESAELFVSRLGLSANWIDQQLNVSTIDAETKVGSISGVAEVETASPYPIRLQLNTKLKVDKYPELVSATTLSGTLEEIQIEHSSDVPYSLTLSGVIQNPIEAPRLDIVLTTHATNLENIVGESVALILTSDIAVKGPLSELAISGTASTKLPEVGKSSASFQGVVQQTGVQLSELTVLLPEVGTGARLGISGTVRWDQSSPVINASIGWDRIQWPLQGEPVAAGVNGKAQINGTLDNYTVEINSGLESPLQEDGFLKASATGSPESIDIQTFVLKALEGEISGNGNVQFKNGLSISAQLQGENVNPRTFLPDWPGNINFKTNAKSRIEDSSFSVSLPELTASGELRGYPIDAKVSGELRDTNLTIDKFDVTSGSTRLTASGKVSDQIGMSWALESEDLASLWPELAGQLNADGQLTGSKDRPIINASIDGTSLKYKDIVVEKLAGTVKLGQSEAYEGTVLIDASSIKVGSYTSESVHIDVSGLRSNHTLNVTLKDALGESRLKAIGALTDETDYSLELRTAEIDSSDLGVWSLTDPVMMQLKETRLEVPKSCLAQGISKLCFALLSESENLSADVEVVEIPLSLFAYVLPTTVKASGKINGGGNIVVATNSNSYGKLHFDVDGLTLQSRLRNETRDSTLSFTPSTLTADVSESGTISATANFPLVSGGGLSFEGRVIEEDRPVLDRALEGQFSIAVPSVAFVADFVPQLSSSKGSLDGLINLSGSIRQPELLGSLELQNGQLTLIDPGVQATDVSLRLTGSRKRTITIAGSAKSGGGAVKLDGQLILSEAGNSGEFKLEGSDFQVMNTSDIQVWATPDIALEYNDTDGLKLTGSVRVPRAKVEIDELPQGTIKVSKDQIIVGQTQKEEGISVPLDARLELILGDDVYLSAFGLDTFLDGSLTLIEKPGKPTSANGKIQLRDGKYKAYGQDLKVTTGNLIYAGGPIDEPGIDFRAVRKPVPEVEVGISARGTLNQPTFTVFSTPSMSESDQLAYLIFGRPMNAEAASENTLITRLALSLGMQGGEALSQKLAGELGVDQLGIESQGSGDLSQASLVIGKYLSPRLFVSYGIGLLEPISTLKLEYALSSKWQLITESSTTRNSADAQYMFER